MSLARISRCSQWLRRALAPRGVATLGLVLASAWWLGCSDPQRIDDGELGTGMSMLIVSGNGQTGRAATELAQPLVVQVRKNGRAVQGQIVNFVVATASDPLVADAGSDASQSLPRVVDTVFKGRAFAGPAATSANRHREFTCPPEPPTSHAQN